MDFRLQIMFYDSQLFWIRLWDIMEDFETFEAADAMANALIDDTVKKMRIVSISRDEILKVYCNH